MDIWTIEEKMYYVLNKPAARAAGLFAKTRESTRTQDDLKAVVLVEKDILDKELRSATFAAKMADGLGFPSHIHFYQYLVNLQEKKGIAFPFRWI